MYVGVSQDHNIGAPQLPAKFPTKRPFRLFFFGGETPPPIQLGFSSQISISFRAIHPQSLTWNLKMMVSNRDLLFQELIFKCHVKLQGHIRFFSRQKTHDFFVFPPLSFGLRAPSSEFRRFFTASQKGFTGCHVMNVKPKHAGGDFVLNSLLGGRNETSCFVHRIVNSQHILNFHDLKFG